MARPENEKCKWCASQNWRKKEKRNNQPECFKGQSCWKKRAYYRKHVTLCNNCHKTITKFYSLVGWNRKEYKDNSIDIDFIKDIANVANT